jgi:hypothetical protein
MSLLTALKISKSDHNKFISQFLKQALFNQLICFNSYNFDLFNVNAQLLTFQ